MKVLYVSRSASVHDIRFLDAWRSQGVEVASMVCEIAMDAEPTAVWTDRFGEFARDFTPDLVQAGPIVDVGYAVSRAWNGPLIMTSWGFDLMDEIDRSPSHRQRATVALSAASVLLTDNDQSTARARTLGMPEEGIVQFPWGIDLAEFTAEGDDLRPALGWDHSHWVVGCTRRLEPYYDVATVVAGFAEFAADRPQARLLLTGGGSLTPSIKAQARQLGIEDKTVLLGEVEHGKLSRVYRTLDAYVSASLVDGTSVSLLEAMACRVPVCVSNIPGNRQWVRGDTGLTFAAGQPRELAAALEVVERGKTPDGQPVEQLVDNAQKLVQGEANWSVTQQRFRALAELAIGRHREAVS